MGILKKAIARKEYNHIVNEKAGVDMSSSMRTGYGSRSQNGDYENLYPSAQKAEQAFAKIRPYAIDAKGDKVMPSPHALQRLARPNREMSGYRFRLALASCYLMHDETYIRVHYSGDKLTADNITGFTFVEGTRPFIQGGKKIFNLPSGKQLTEDEVLTLPSGVNPFYVTGGFSAARAVRRWTTLDDYIVDYQTGFFRNGAVPAGQFVITAKTEEEYLNIMDKMKKAHQGADKNNNVIYSHRPIDDDDQPNAATIEWVSYDQKNKDLAVKDLVDASTNRMDGTIGVPKQIRGLIEGSHYNGLRLAEYVLVEHVARPMATEIWDAFTQELNRVTGGTGFAITFTLETPVVQDEELVRSKRKETEARTITQLAEKGFTLESIVNAFDYPKSYLELEQEEVQDEDEEEVINKPEDLPSQDPEVQRQEGSKILKKVAARDIDGLYDGLDIDTDNLGCIMANVEKLEVLKHIKNAADDLTETEMDYSNVPGEDVPHVTLLFGLLSNGNAIKDKVDKVLAGWSLDAITVEEVSYFDVGESYAIVAKIKKTPELIDAHERLTLLPNIQTHSEYKPHVTLAYIKKDAGLRGKWIETLGDEYNGKELSVIGLNYGDEPKKSEKSISKLPNEREATEENEDDVWRRSVQQVAQERLQEQVDAILAELPGTTSRMAKQLEPTDEDNRSFMERLLAILLPILNIRGGREYRRGLTMVLDAGLETDGTSEWQMSDEKRQRYAQYLERVATSYNSETAEKAKQILADAQAQGLTSNEIRAKIRQLPELEGYRAERLARSEVHNTQGRGSVDAMRQIKQETGYIIEKIWRADADPCEYCQAMDGTVVDVDKDFLELGQTVKGVEGGEFANKFTAVESASLHPNDECRMEYRVRRT